MDPLNSTIYHPHVVDLHYDFTSEAPDVAVPAGTGANAAETTTDLEAQERARLKRAREAALTDGLGHGTHVAGIIASVTFRIGRRSNR